MRPAARRLLWILGSAAGALLLLILLLPYVVSLDAIRARVVSEAQKALHRKVEVGRVRLQIFSGLGAGVESVVVHNKEGWESPTLLTAQEVSVKVAFWALLSRRVEVRRVVLRGVTLTIERAPDGKLNVSDFVSAGGRESPAAAQTAAAALLVSRLDFEGGRVAFVDRRVSPGATVTTALEDLVGRIADIGPSTPARFDLAARFLADKGRNLTLQGTFGPPPASGPIGQAPLRASFAAKNVELKRLGPYTGASGTTSDPGLFSLSGAADGAPLGKLTLSGRLDLEPGSSSSRLPNVDGTFSLALDWPAGMLAITDSLFSAANLPMKIRGRVDRLHAEPRIDLEVTTPGEVSIDDVTGLPGIAGTLPESVRLSGKLRLQARIQGGASDFDMSGSVDAAPLAVTFEGQPVMSAPSARATLAGKGKAPMTGTITAPSGQLKSVPFEGLQADWTWNAGAFTITPSASVYGGTLSGRLDSNFSHAGSDSHISLEARHVQVQPLVEATTSARDVLAGNLDGTIAITSRGLSWDAVSKTGHGEGRVSVTDADLRTVRLMPEVARSLSAVGQVAGFRVPPSLESTKFSTLQTSLRLADGRVTTPDLALAGRDVAVSADGSIGLDRTIAYKGRIVLGPAVTKSLGSTGRYLADSEGKLSLPFSASGPLASPKVAIDDSVVLDLGRRVLARQAGEKLGGSAGKMLGDVLAPSDGKSASPVDILQQLLRAPAPGATPRPTPH